jgi:ribonuclease BN (tRNA processing enzyme)
MRFTTIGTGTISLSPARSCAAYLLEQENVRLLLDCGSGAARRLAELHLPWRDISHIALTHFHIDHHADLPTLIFAWKYGDLPPRSAPLEIIGPAGTRSLIERLANAYGSWVLDPGFAITIREIAPGDRVELSAGLSLSAAKVPHSAESVAYCMAVGEHRIVYTGDTGYDEALADWACGCDLLVCECSLPASMAIKEHLTPEECGRLAARAAPRSLALTHFYPPVEQVNVQALVAASYSGPVTLAYDGWSVEIETHQPVAEAR